MNGAAKTTKSDPVKLTFFGDSIFVGQGVSIFRGWVTRVAERLDQHAASKNRPIIVSNSSVNGRTTRQALEDMPYHVQSHEPDILVVQFGLNDCNYWQTDRGVPRVSRNAFKANLEEIAARALTFGAKRVLLNNNHPTTKMGQGRINYEESNRDYNEAVREVARGLGERVMFQDVEAHFRALFVAERTQSSDYLLDDGLHLNDAGHTAYFQLMCPVILDAVDGCLACS